MTKHTTKMTAGDQTMTIVAAEGKSGWNVKASIKTGNEKVKDGGVKAITGARAKFDNEAEAVKVVAKLVKDAEGKGWTKREISAKNAFTEIPAPTASTAVAKRAKK